VSGSLVSPATRQRVRDLATPIATALGRLGLTPNALTLIGFAGTVVAAFAAANQWWLAAGVLVLVFGIFDLFDGTLARATGQATKLGAFLDSTFDRAGEAIVFIGISIGLLAAGFREGAILAAGAMAASFMVSYTRAKSESLGFTPGTGMANVGIMPREVRLAILSVALILATEPIYAVPPPGAACMGVCDFPQGGSISIGLLVIAIGSVITTIQRIAHVVAQSREG
jgi:CDP-diacylglycerol--glycerol-3-phosphate 3-phosphatidyltransferase